MSCPFVKTCICMRCANNGIKCGCIECESEKYFTPFYECPLFVEREKEETKDEQV